MPIYDYRCIACAHEIEVVHAIAAAGPSVCEVCGGAMRKAMSAPAIHFKGSGWAKKDAQSAKKASAKADKPKDDAKQTGDAGGKPGTDESKTPPQGAKSKTEATSGSASGTTPG
jgi:putative FmdB family regulatory protein